MFLDADVDIYLVQKYTNKNDWHAEYSLSLNYSTGSDMTRHD